MTTLQQLGLGALIALVSACQGGASAAGNSDSSNPSPRGSDEAPGEGVGGNGSPPEGQVVSSPHPAGFACDPLALRDAPPLRRLTRRQFVHTVSALLTFATDDAARAAEIMETGRVAEALAQVPNDERQIAARDLHGSYRRLDQEVQQSHAEAWLAVAIAVGQELTRPELIEVVVGPCAADGNTANDAACLSDFVSRFGARALRRELTDQERVMFAAFAGGPPNEEAAAYADVIAGLMSAPQFNYHVEEGGELVGDLRSTRRLSSYELASRLSYHFWDAPPDAELLAAAANGSLDDDAGYQAEVERLFADGRTQQTTREFFREWLKLERVAEFGDWERSPRLTAFAGPNLPSSELRQALIDEALDMAQYHTWQQPGSLRALLLSSLSFSRSAELSALYGSEVWDGQSTPPELSEPERAGLFTRAAFLVTGTDGSRPIMRGVFIRQNVLCDEIPPPPDNVQNAEGDTEGPQSTRRFVEELTEAEGSACAGCHQNYINPIGFSLEAFDALGRLRSEEIVRANDGSEIARFEIDTQTAPGVVLGDGAQAEGPAGLMDLINESGKAEACLARHYFRFSFGRFEDVRSDGCALERLRSTLAETGSISGMLKGAALDPSFRQRTLSEVE